MKQKLIFLCGMMLATTASAQESVPPAQALASLFKSYAADTAPYFPFAASDNGMRKYDSIFANDLSEEYRAGLKSLCGNYLGQLRQIERPALSRQDQLSHDIFAYRLKSCLTNFDYPWHLMPVNQVGSSWPASFPVIGSGKGAHPFKTVRNYEDFLHRIDGFVVWVDSAIVNMRSGAARGVTLPRDAMLKVVPQLDAHIVDDPAKSLFHEPITRFPAEFDDETRKALTAKYLVAIESKIVPAYRRLRSFIQDEYLPKCRSTVGLQDLPGGRDMYRQAVRDATTTDLAPEEIYQLGLAEVQRISAELATLDAEIEAAKEPGLPKYRDAESLLGAYRALRSTVEAALPKFFSRLPKADFEIRAIEAYRESSMPSSYIFPSNDGARPGVFYLNAASLKTSGEAVVSRSLFLHEAIPGHHMQIALQKENRQLPLFRRSLWYSASGEGWALYAEGLGVEMGLYQAPRDKREYLINELFRAARLVVDVGLHDKSWTRSQAIEYMQKSGRQSEANAEREVERYMAWPGQALSYKIGQLKISALRKKAEKALGAAFDIRAFHDEVLRDGAMPLSILEDKMDRWLMEQVSKQGR
ncbi:DUF885 domain-containing protein [soil metagenome]